MTYRKGDHVMHMGETIRALRLERGVTQEQLAKYLSSRPISACRGGVVRHLLDGCMESFRAELREPCFDPMRERCRFDEK